MAANVPPGKRVKMGKVNKQMNIMDIIDIDDGCASIFMESGMGCLGCAAAHFENLEQACAVHGIDADALEKKLNDYLDSQS
jgi:hybrid cluster-associated redox disulfide protein